MEKSSVDQRRGSWKMRKGITCIKWDVSEQMTNLGLCKYIIFVHSYFGLKCYLWWCRCCCCCCWAHLKLPLICLCSDLKPEKSARSASAKRTVNGRAQVCNGTAAACRSDPAGECRHRPVKWFLRLLKVCGVDVSVTETAGHRQEEAPDDNQLALTIQEVPHAVIMPR